MFRRKPERVSLLRSGFNGKSYLINIYFFMNKKISTGKIIGLVVLGILIILAFWIIGTYNSLVTLNENVKTAQADIEAVYQRRFDLIPNLVSSVQGIFNQERAVFGQLAEARTRYSSAQSGSPEKIVALNQVESALGRLIAIVENYPNLRSSEAVLRLQDQLEGTENRISVARTNYNAVVNQLNKKVNFFPSNTVARMFGFVERERFQVTEESARTAPKVEFEIK